MSDYLSNLAARSLQAVPTIRPRLASFYETPQRGFALPPEPAAESGEVIDDVLAVPAEPRESRASPPSKRPVITVITADAPDAAVTGAVDPPRSASIPAVVVDDETSAMPTPAPPPPRRTADRVAEPRLVTSPTAAPIANTGVSETPREQRGRRDIPATLAEPDRADERASDSTPRAEMTQADRIAVRVAAPDEHHAPEVRHGETETPLVIARHRQHPQVQPKSAPLSLRPHEEAARSFDDPEAVRIAAPRERMANSEPPMPERLPSPIAMHRITPSRIVAESQSPLRVPPVARSPRIHHPSPSAPDVHITIGRVEVRAVPAAEPPPRSRSAAPAGVMNLDDYLRRRDGKGRR